jgi:transposase/uncharacterized protein (UPF0179 family)
MGKAQPTPGKLFYDNIRLVERIRSDHPLRTIRKLVDFDFAYREVEDCYGCNGNVSLPPPVILKLMFLLFYYDVASERELMNTLPERLDWLWFLGYDLDTRIPDHSVLSKARERWGVEVFRCLFTRIVEQCVALKLVDGRKVYGDSSLVDANAANDSIKETNPSLVICGQLEQRLNAEQAKPETDAKPRRPYVSTTDPDAAVVSGRGGARARFKTHRLVDDRQGIITATEVTAGDVNEAHRLPALLEQHEQITEQKVRTVTADTKYGTIDNYLYCHDHNVTAHMPDMKQATAHSGRKAGMFSDREFRYCPEEDVYYCPAGQRLVRKRYHKARQSYDYCGAREVCDACPLRARCTTARKGRSIKRHERQTELEQMRREATGGRARQDLKRRKSIMEGSFADGANNHGLKRARWRGLPRMAIQDYLIAAVQNIRIMVRGRLKLVGTGAQALVAKVREPISAICCSIGVLFGAFRASPARIRLGVTSA